MYTYNYYCHTPYYEGFIFSHLHPLRKMFKGKQKGLALCHIKTI